MSRIRRSTGDQQHLEADKQSSVGLKGRIKALAEKTVSNGCTEAEAMAAAEMVGRLLERYALSMEEIDVREERCVQIEVPIGGTKAVSDPRLRHGGRAVLRLQGVDRTRRHNAELRVLRLLCAHGAGRPSCSTSSTAHRDRLDRIPDLRIG